MNLVGSRLSLKISKLAIDLAQLAIILIEAFGPSPNSLVSKSPRESTWMKTQKETGSASSILALFQIVVSPI